MYGYYSTYRYSYDASARLSASHPAKTTLQICYKFEKKMKVPFIFLTFCVLYAKRCSPLAFTRPQQIYFISRAASISSECKSVTAAESSTILSASKWDHIEDEDEVRKLKMSVKDCFLRTRQETIRSPCSSIHSLLHPPPYRLSL